MTYPEPASGEGMPRKEALNLAVFTADTWEHVCPIIRITAPAEQAGLCVLRGSDWIDGKLVIYPERAAQADVVVIQRNFPTYSAAYQQVMQAARVNGKPVVYEIDDLLTELPDSHPDAAFYLTARTAIIQAAAEADAVTGCTQTICDYFREVNPNVHLLPNYLIDRFWTLRPPAGDRRGPLVIGYMGGHSHTPDLEIIAPVLGRLARRYSDRISFKFMGIAPPAGLRGRPNVEQIDLWLGSYVQFAEYFARQHCDLYLAPLGVNLFNRGKSHLKFLEYSAAGAPGVYSRITPYEGIVTHGDNGFLAGSAEEWEHALIELIENAELRREMGANAQETVRQHWLLSAHAGKWAQVYAQLAGDQTHPKTSPAVLALARRMHAWQSDLETRAASQAAQIRDLRRERDRLECERDRLENNLVQKESSFHLVYARYEELVNSRSWRMMQKLIRLRLKVMPKAGRLEQLLKLAIYPLRILRQEGAGAFLRGSLRRSRAMLQGDGLPPAVVQSLPPGPRMIQTQGERVRLPAVSLVSVSDGLGPDLDSVQTWLSRQTGASLAQLVVWDAASGTAWKAGEPEIRSEALDAKSLCSQLASRYVCLASEDLLGQNETYLEANLAALETEGLAFTVNFNGLNTWPLDLIRQGKLPGSTRTPLLRTVVRRECVTNGFAIDLSPYLARVEGHPQPVGKVLLHTSSQTDQPGVVPFEAPLPLVDWHMSGKRVFARSQAGLPWEPVVQVIHPVDEVLPPQASPSDLPTVILALQFMAVGGAEQLALNVINGLKDQVRFVVITIDEHLPELGTTNHLFRQTTPYVYSVPDYVDPSLRLSFYIYLIERFQPVTFYIANGASYIYDVLPEIKKRYPHLRTANQVYDHQEGWIERYDLPLVRNLDAHIGVNRKICQAYVEQGVRPENAYHIPHGLASAPPPVGDYDEARRFEVRRKLGLPLEKRVITFASRLHPQKRPLDFVEIARRMAGDPSLVFLIAGDGPLTSAVKEQAARLQLKNFHHVPFYRPIWDILAVTDVVVLPSDYEGMPMIVAESQAMGKPVVVTDVGNNREVLELTGGGVIVNQPGDITALVDGVRKMLDAKLDVQKMRQVILTEYATDDVIDRYRLALLPGKNG